MAPGELYVLSDATFAAYYKDADKYEKGKRPDGFMTVGDIAYQDDEGFFYICDRKNDMIISGGVNIYPAEIEAVLIAHPSDRRRRRVRHPRRRVGRGRARRPHDLRRHRRRCRRAGDVLPRTPRGLQGAAHARPDGRDSAFARAARSSSANSASRTGKAAPPRSGRHNV